MWPVKAPSAAIRAGTSPHWRADQHRHHALADVAQPRQCRGVAIAGAQHVCCADIAGADLADVAEADRLW